MMDLEAMVEESAAALEPFDAPTLVHGDLTFENVLWDPPSSRITAILDFEWARRGPADLDLDVLLRCVAYPKLHVAADYEHLTQHRGLRRGALVAERGLPRAVQLPPPARAGAALRDRVGRARAAPLPAERASSASCTPPTRTTGSCARINGTSYLDTMDAGPVPERLGPISRHRRALGRRAGGRERGRARASTPASRGSAARCARTRCRAARPGGCS